MFNLVCIQLALRVVVALQKGLVLGVYKEEGKNEVGLTPSAAKYNEITQGKLLDSVKL